MIDTISRTEHFENKLEDTEVILNILIFGIQSCYLRDLQIILYDFNNSNKYPIS